jgi:hypothetical protein
MEPFYVGLIDRFNGPLTPWRRVFLTVAKLVKNSPMLFKDALPLTWVRQ